MHVAKVGQLYSPNRHQWKETIEYSYDVKGHTLLLFVEDPAPEEIEGIRNQSIDIRFLNIEELIVIIFQFGEKGKYFPWSDSGYSWYAIPPNRRRIPKPIEAGEAALLNIILIDADTGIVKVSRTVSLPTRFSTILVKAIREQISGEEITPTRQMQLTYQAQSQRSEELASISRVRCLIPQRETVKKLNEYSVSQSGNTKKSNR